MDTRKHEELKDEPLEREIEAALDVDPSPEFLARVRTRIARERADETWGWQGQWRWASAALALVVVAAAGFWIGREPLSAPHESASVKASRNPEPGTQDSGVKVRADPEPYVPGLESAREVIASSKTPQPVVAPRDARVSEPLFAPSDVLISQEEAAALRQLFAAITNRRLETAALPDLDAALQPPAPIEDIVVEPLSVSPLASLESE